MIRRVKMASFVRIPPPLRRFTNNVDVIEITAGTILELLEKLESRFPGICERLCDEQGQLRRFVNIYVDGEDIRFLSGLMTEIKDGAEISIVPAIAGGNGQSRTLRAIASRHASRFEIATEELSRLLSENGKRVRLVDVRTPEEHDYCRIERSVLIPLNELPWRAAELNPADEIVLYCHHGVRSLMAAHLLRSLGFRSVRILKGGIDAWAKMVDSSMPRY